MAETWVEQIVYQRPETLLDVATHYCPGCSHGLIHKLIAEVIDELGIRERTIAVAPVGCAVFLYNYLDVDSAEAAHGRAPAMGCCSFRGAWSPSTTACPRATRPSSPGPPSPWRWPWAAGSGR